jgi:hypothetical protein
MENGQNDDTACLRPKVHAKRESLRPTNGEFVAAHDTQIFVQRAGNQAGAARPPVIPPKPAALSR